MRHVTISQFGKNLGISGNRLVVTDHDGKRWETALSRLRSIRIEKRGVSLSSDLVYQCAVRGIRIFFLDWRHISVASLGGANQHAVVALRQAQFSCIETDTCSVIALEFIRTKMKNQRAVLLYFCKYLSKNSSPRSVVLKEAASEIEKLIKNIDLIDKSKDWREWVMGIEGVSASIYWKALSQAELLPQTFERREGRGALELTNAALNYGYSILQSYVWSALDNAGLELYAGFLHKKRIGRASLVMDFMEEYRPWVVDRNIIKLRFQISQAITLDRDLKKTISNAIDNTLQSALLWRGKKIKLENIMQRQAYRLGGAIVGEKTYRGLRFKW